MSLLPQIHQLLHLTITSFIWSHILTLIVISLTLIHLQALNSTLYTNWSKYFLRLPCQNSNCVLLSNYTISLATFSPICPFFSEFSFCSTILNHWNSLSLLFSSLSHQSVYFCTTLRTLFTLSLFSHLLNRPLKAACSISQASQRSVISTPVFLSRTLALLSLPAQLWSFSTFLTPVYYPCFIHTHRLSVPHLLVLASTYNLLLPSYPSLYFPPLIRFHALPRTILTFLPHSIIILTFPLSPLPLFLDNPIGSLIVSFIFVLRFFVCCTKSHFLLDLTAVR